jgi:hypothetical protein
MFVDSLSNILLLQVVAVEVSFVVAVVLVDIDVP